MMEPAVVSPPLLKIGLPEPGEYAPYHVGYISEVMGDDILTTLDAQRRQMLVFLCGLEEEDGDVRYAPDKWSVKEVLGHVCDTERIFTYRALRISRADKTPLPGFEQDDYARNAPFSKRPLAEVIEDYIAVRRATLTLFRNLDEAAWQRRGTVNNNEISVRALAYITAGHEMHHFRILEQKYFTPAVR